MDVAHPKEAVLRDTRRQKKRSYKTEIATNISTAPVIRTLRVLTNAVPIRETYLQNTKKQPKLPDKRQGPG